MSQTSYPVDQAIAFAGLAHGDLARSVSRLNSQGAAIPFGSAVVEDSSDDAKAKLPAGAVGKLLGAVRHTHAVDNQGLVSPGGIPDGEMMSVMREGQMFVKVATAVAKGDAVYVQHTLNLGVEPGEWRNDADGGNAELISAGVSYLTSAAAGEFAVIELNLPA